MWRAPHIQERESCSLEESQAGQLLEIDCLGRVVPSKGEQVAQEIGDRTRTSGSARWRGVGGGRIRTTTPRGKELDESRLSRLEHNIIEVARDQVKDRRLGRDHARQPGEQEALEHNHADG